MSENIVRGFFKRIVEELSDVQVAEINAALHGTLVSKIRVIILDEKTEALHAEIQEAIQGFEYMELGTKIRDLMNHDTKYVKAFHAKMQGKK